MNMYFHEQLAAERRQNIQRDVEHHRIIASLPQSRKRLLRSTADRLGMLLIVVGTKLRQVERVAAA